MFQPFFHIKTKLVRLLLPDPKIEAWKDLTGLRGSELLNQEAKELLVKTNFLIKQLSSKEQIFENNLRPISIPVWEQIHVDRRKQWKRYVYTRTFLKTENQYATSEFQNPHFQNEARCATFLVKMSFICMRMKSDFHVKGWAPTLVLKQRPGETRKWPILVGLPVSTKKVSR